MTETANLDVLFADSLATAILAYPHKTRSDVAYAILTWLDCQDDVNVTIASESS